jgi:RNA polymerase sigma-70 factor (ECF subfamily)
MSMSSQGDGFELHREFLVRLAYRMLGSLADAEDVVQDAFLRWRDIDPATVTHPRGYLARVVSRLCVDRMRSMDARRKAYVGTWLPDPVVTQPDEPLADDLSLALLMTLERLSALERAAFLMHDVFDMDYSEIADMLERSEAACRQLTVRAREHVRQSRARFPSDDKTREQLVEAFIAAAFSGNVTALADVLAEDAALYADGGGKRPATPYPIHGRANIMAFFAMVAANRQSTPSRGDTKRVDINALPGFVVRVDDGLQTIAFEIAGDRIAAIYVVRNPDKLRHLS